MDCSPPGSLDHGIFQARILEWVAISYSRANPGIEQTSPVAPALAGRFFTTIHKKIHKYTHTHTHKIHNTHITHTHKYTHASTHKPKDAHSNSIDFGYQQAQPTFPPGTQPSLWFCSKALPRVQGAAYSNSQLSSNHPCLLVQPLGSRGPGKRLVDGVSLANLKRQHPGRGRTACCRVLSAHHLIQWVTSG